MSLVWPSLLVALVALGGSLWLSIGMKLKACPLCFYQRTFVMGVVAVLGIGVLTGQRHRAVLNLLALPLAVAGLGVAAFHVYLELTGKLECPAGVLGIGTAPQQSFVVLAFLLALIIAGVVRSGTLGEAHLPPASLPQPPAAERACRAGCGRPGGQARLATAGAAVVLGLLLAWGAVASSPPMPPTPPQAYTTPLDICRPPFHPQ